MSFLPDRIVVWGILCCIFLLINDVQCKRKSVWKPTTPKKTTRVTVSKEDIRLVHSADRCIGKLQVKSNDSWRYVCHSKFTAQNALVTCRHLDCGFPSRIYGYEVNSGEDDSWSATFNCSGQEQDLGDCPVAPLESDYRCALAVLECSEKPKHPEISVYSLKGPERPYGSVYVGHSYVVECRIDALFKVHSFVLRVFNDGNWSEWSQPAEDNAAYFFLPYRNNDVSLRCHYNFEIQPETVSGSCYGGVYFKDPSNYMRLVGEESQCLGSLELEHEGEWRAVSQQHWGLKEAAVVCRQLHCGSVISTDTQSRELQPVWRFYSDCDGSERALLGCGSIREGQSVSTVSVLCSDILHPANISAASEKNSSREDSLIVYSLYTFYINCSVLPQFPGGDFSLVFTGVKPSLTRNQTAVNHSAVFTFDLSEKAQSGNYSCIYHNTVSGHHFSSQSPQLVIVVEDGEDVLLDDGGTRHLNRPVCSGTLLVKDSSQTMMVTAETLHWDMRHASIVCRQLGCGSALSISETQIPKVSPMWRFFSDCDGSEAALLQCGHVQEWFSTKAIVVVCEG